MTVGQTDQSEEEMKIPTRRFKQKCSEVKFMSISNYSNQLDKFFQNKLVGLKPLCFRLETLGTPYWECQKFTWQLGHVSTQISRSCYSCFYFCLNQWIKAIVCSSMQKGQIFLQGLTDTDFLGPTLILGSKKIAISDSLANIKKIYNIICMWLSNSGDKDLWWRQDIWHLNKLYSKS